MILTCYRVLTTMDNVLEIESLYGLDGSCCEDLRDENERYKVRSF